MIFRFRLQSHPRDDPPVDRASPATLLRVARHVRNVDSRHALSPLKNHQTNSPQLFTLSNGPSFVRQLYSLTFLITLLLKAHHLSRSNEISILDKVDIQFLQIEWIF